MTKAKRVKKKLGAFAGLLMSIVTVCGVGFGISGNSMIASAATAKRWTSDYSSKEETIQAAAELNLQIAQEGMVLLKNDDVGSTNTASLPVKTGVGTNAARISVFGYASVKPTGGGNAEGEDNSAGTVRLASDIYSSLEDAGYKINPVVEGLYRDWTSSNSNKSDYALNDKVTSAMKNSKVIASCKDYSDAAIVVINAPNTTGSRYSQLLSSAMSDELGDKWAHIKQLDAAQVKLIDEVTEVFDNVVLVLNTNYPLELGESADKVQSILIAGQPGANGFVALGQILSGEINPSGRTVDIFPTEFENGPTFMNFAKGIDVNNLNNTSNVYTDSNGNAYVPVYQDYEEGIYVGYKYYETRYATFNDADDLISSLPNQAVETGLKENGTDSVTADDWYKANVAFPFGYGLSYTTFGWEAEWCELSSLGKDSTVTVKVKVTNTGCVAGKDVVQLYYTAPYETGKVEKSAVELGAFAKTGLLQPGESETVTLALNASDMASYDYITNKTYILDAGDYTLSLRTDSHNVKNNLTHVYSVNSLIKCDTSITGETITNQFDYMSDEFKTYDAATESWSGIGDNAAIGTQGLTVLSRADWEATWPSARTAAERVLTDEQYKTWAVTVDKNYDDNSPWYVESMPSYATSSRSDKATVMLKDLIGLGYDDSKWDTLVASLTIDELAELINYGGYGSQAIEYIGKPYALDGDGPVGWVSGNGIGGSVFSYASAPMRASTFNIELVYELGKLTGDLGLWGNSDQGEDIHSYSGWYAVAMNLHRSVFDGRMTEYYSEDSYLTGIIGANETAGIRSKGGYVTIKHFAMHEYAGQGTVTDRGVDNNQENSEYSGTSIWATEQTIREIYLKPFQMVVEQADPMGAMASFSRFGNVWAGGSYNLMTQVLRNEWGFKGFVVTDISQYKYLNVDQMIRAGTDMLLYSAQNGKPNLVSTDNNSLTATQVAAMQRAAKNILYTVANSNAMYAPAGAAINYSNPAVTELTAGTQTSLSVATANLNTTNTYGTIMYRVTGGDIPLGMEFNNRTGELVGTPTTEGTYTFTVTAYATDYQSASVDYTVIVSGAETSTVSTMDIVTLSLICVTLACVVAGVVLVIIFKKKN